MAVKYIGDGQYRGLSSDTKPTTGIYAGATFFEEDSRLVFYWTGTVWTNRLLTTVPAVASSAEVLGSWTVSDSASASKIQFDNASATDAIFVPWIRAHNLDTAGHPGLYFYAYIGTALDTGVEAGIRFDARRQDNSALVTRPLFSFRNAGTEVISVGPKGAILQVVTSQASTFEILHTWKVSDDASSSFLLMNNTSTDGHFSPILISTYAQALSTQRAFTLRAQIPTAQDSGTTAAIVMDARKVDGTAIATRPLFEFHSLNTSVFRIGAKGDIFQSMQSTAAAAEILHTWQISDGSTSRLEIRNASATDAEFVPRITSLNLTANATHPGLYLDAFVDTAQDSGTQQVVVFRAFKLDGTALVTRPLFDFRNGPSASLFRLGQTQMDTPLTVAINKTAIAGGAEVLQTWKVSDDANSQIELRNASTTNGEFVPWFRVYNYAANNTNPGLYLYSHIQNDRDNGTIPVLIFDSRRIDSTAITIRPLFDFRTGSVSVFKINPTNVDMTNKELKNAHFMDKIGQYSCSSMYGVDGWGLLGDLQGYGTFSKNADSTGSGHFWSTGTTIGTAAGIAQLGAVGSFIGWMRIAYLPYVRVKTVIPAYTTADSRFYFGWFTTATLVPNSDTPMNVNDGGILVGYRSTDTNYQIFRGPADGVTTPPAPIDTGVVIAAAGTLYFFEIRVNSTTSVDVTIYNSGMTVLHTSNLTTNLPASTKSVNFNSIMYNTTTTSKTLTFYSMAMRSTS